MLNAVGVQRGTDLASAYPTVIDESYVTVWKEFLTTRVVKEIIKMWPKEQARMYVAAAFVSYISSINDKALKRKVNLLQSLEFYQVRSRYSDMVEFMQRKRMLLDLRMFSYKFDISYNDVDFIRALVRPTCTGHFVFKTQNKVSVDSVLHSFVPTLFRTLPYELSTEVNGKKRPPRAASKVLESNVGWIGLLNEDGLYMELARAAFDTLLIRYSFPTDTIIFYGNGSAAEADKKVRSLHRRSIILP